jgi:hypothetical protein
MSGRPAPRSSEPRPQERRRLNAAESIRGDACAGGFDARGAWWRGPTRWRSKGVEARLVEVQCAIAAGLPAFNLVGLPDKAVSEAKERVRAALSAMGLALPAKRITVNLSPADLPKEGSHFDLPIALAVLAAMEVLPADAAAGNVALGELSLDGSLIAVIGALAGGGRGGGGRLRADLPGGLRGGGGLGGGGAGDRAQEPARARQHFNGRRAIPPARPGAVARPAPARPRRRQGAGEGQARARDRRRRAAPPADGWDRRAAASRCSPPGCRASCRRWSRRRRWRPR